LKFATSYLKLTATESSFATRNNPAKNGSFGFHEIVQKLIRIWSSTLLCGY